MNDKNRNLVIRVLTAAVLLPLVILLLVKGGHWFAAAGMVVAALSAMEYYGIVFKTLGPAAWVGVALAGFLPWLPVLAPENAFNYAFWCIAGFGLWSWAYHLIRGPLKEAPTLVAHLQSGLLLAGVGLTSLIAVRTHADGVAWVVSTLVVTWGQDTTAYFFGRFLGKHKLYPAVSPAKTWEGFAGGFVGSIGGMFITRGFFFPELLVMDCILLGLWGGFIGPIGDLSESMLKRAYGVKDSGKVIPGHGGLLDRVDALLFVAPGVFAYLSFFRDRL